MPTLLRETVHGADHEVECRKIVAIMSPPGTKGRTAAKSKSVANRRGHSRGGTVLVAPLAVRRGAVLVLAEGETSRWTCSHSERFCIIAKARLYRGVNRISVSRALFL